LATQITAANATCGVRITVEAGTPIPGNFILGPASCGTNQNLLEGSTVGLLPAWQYPSKSLAGTPGIATIVGTANSTAALSVADNTNGWYVSALEITLAPTVTGGCVGNALCSIVGMGEYTSTIAALPKNITFDRVLVHPAACLADSYTTPCKYATRGIDLNAVGGYCLACTVYGLVEPAQDTQAIAIFNTTGPGMIVMCYLEASGENILFNTEATNYTPATEPNGIPIGSTGFVTGDIGLTTFNVPSDYVVKYNHLEKLLAWQTLPAGCVAGTAQPCYDVKNLFEIKYGQRILLDSNVLDTTYASGQAEAVISNCFYAGIYACQDFQVTSNLMKHMPQVAALAGNGFPIISSLCGGTGQPTCTIEAGIRILWRNNVAIDVSCPTYGGTGGFMQIQNTRNLTIDHNTTINEQCSNFTQGLDLSDQAPVTNIAFTFTNNIEYGGFFADAANEGGAIDGVPSPLLGGDYLIGDPWPNAYPAGNGSPAATATPPYPSGINVLSSTTQPTGQAPCNYAAYWPKSGTEVSKSISACWSLDWATVLFTDLTGGNAGTNLPGLVLLATSPLKGKATDGTDPGANITAVTAAVAQVK
jgi:hypothetical protein